jgi:hypothetical protein
MLPNSKVNYGGIVVDHAAASFLLHESEAYRMATLLTLNFKPQRRW